MLHIVRDSPFATRTLEQCLLLAGEGDHLLLTQDGVIAACAPAFLPQLQQAGLPLYILAESRIGRCGTCYYHDSRNAFFPCHHTRSMGA